MTIPNEVLLTELTPTGWRGLLSNGQIFVVENSGFPDGEIVLDGHPVALPRPDGRLSEYCELLKPGAKPAEALARFDAARLLADTAIAQLQRGVTLLALGRWSEGFAQWVVAGQRQQCLDLQAKGMRRWQGEDLAGKRLLLVHDHGFGDSIMMLRYIPRLKHMGADVRVWLPPELLRLGSQVATVVEEPVEADYFCSLLFLLEMFKIIPQAVSPRSYLTPDKAAVERWRKEIPPNAVGIAWAPGHKYSGDYPRFLVPEYLMRWFSGRPLVSVQKGGSPPAGILAPDFTDFADCAALMAVLDEIVTVDTAAVHLAGAIGHPKLNLLLDHHHASWRWLAPWYRLTTWRLDLERPAEPIR